MICVKRDTWSTLSTAKEKLEIKTHCATPRELQRAMWATCYRQTWNASPGRSWVCKGHGLKTPNQAGPLPPSLSAFLRGKSCAAVFGDQIHWSRSLTVLTALTAVRWIWRMLVALQSMLSLWYEILLSFFWRFLPEFEKSRFPAFICDPRETAAGLL